MVMRIENWGDSSRLCRVLLCSCQRISARHAYSVEAAAYRSPINRVVECIPDEFAWAESQLGTVWCYYNLQVCALCYNSVTVILEITTGGHRPTRSYFIRRTIAERSISYHYQSWFMKHSRGSRLLKFITSSCLPLHIQNQQFILVEIVYCTRITSHLDFLWVNATEIFLL